MSSVLVFAPHNDDEVLGVGGTIRKHVLNGDCVTVCEVTSGPKFKLLQKEARKAHGKLGVYNTYFLNLPVGELRNIKQADINRKIVEIVNVVAPEIAYIPFIGDMHIDHRETVESAMVALRPIHNKTIKEIYMYETLSETGWNLTQPDRSFIPNVWVDITETFSDKLEAMSCYQSQIFDYPHPRSAEALESLAKFRGSTVGVMYAEGLMAVRIIK